MKSQNDRLLSHLKQGRKVTSYSAMELLGIASLHRRLADLREQGHDIYDKWEQIQNRYGEKVRIKVYQLRRMNKAA